MQHHKKGGMCNFCDKWIRLAANICNKSKTGPKGAEGMVQRHRWEDQEGCSSQAENTNENVLVMKKMMGFSTSQYELRHQKSPLTANNILQGSFSILGGIFLHPLVFTVSQQLSRQVVDHKYLRVGRVKYLRNYQLTCSPLHLNLNSLLLAQAAKAQSCQHCRYAAKLIVLF